jgi:hypothetical protein
MRFSRTLFLPAAGLAALVCGTATGQTPASVTLSDVYSLVASTTTNNVVSLNGFDQHRGLALNTNPGSPWAGTLYITRRAQPTPAATAAVFFWRAVATNPSAKAGSGTLTPSGPDLANPDGIFSNAAILAAGYDPAGGNSFWAIGVAEDDYVYVSGLTSGKVVRCAPDGSSPTLVVSAGFPRVRTFWVTGKGMDTRIWCIKDNVLPPATTTMERWKPTALDGSGGPVGFIQEVLATPAEAVNQLHQFVVDSARSAVYYGRYKSGDPVYHVPPMKRSVAGVEDTLFTDAAAAAEIVRATGAAMDSQDRVVYFAMPQPNRDWGIVAVDPATGANLTTNTSASGAFAFFSPAGPVSTGLDYDNFVYLARYSDRHYFYVYNRAYLAPAFDGSTVIGVFATDVPAAPPLNVSVANSVTPGTVTVRWTLKDPEAVGVDVFRSESAGVLGTKVNGAPLTGGTWDDAGLTIGTTLYYTVRAVCRDPFTGAVYTSVNSNQHPVTVRVPGRPDAPGNQAASDRGDGSGVLLSWTNPASDAAGIRIYRSEAAGVLGSLMHTVTTVTPGANDSWLDAGAGAGHTFYYTIRAANEAGEESPNTNQLRVTATDSVAPAFGGAFSARDMGGPGLRLSWTSATDNTYPITYNIYVSPTPAGFDFAHPAATTTTTAGVFDLGGLTLRRNWYVVVRAMDALGNEEKNTVVVSGFPNRIIVDSDQNGGMNVDRVDPHPDAAFPALMPAPINIPKSQAPDLVPTGYLGRIFYYQTNDTPGKVKYTMPIPQPGRYELAATWSPWSAIWAPGYLYHITYPDGSAEDVVLDEYGTLGNVWHTLAARQMTPGTLTIVGDATQIGDSDPNYWNASGAVRALLLPPSPVSIYRAGAPPTIGAFNASEWAGIEPFALESVAQAISGAAAWSGPSDYTGHVYASWDDANLYIGASVSDDIVSFPATTDDAIWQRDAIEVFVGLTNPQVPRTAYDAGDFEVVLSARDDGGTLSGVWYCPQNPALSGVTPHVAVQRRSGGFTLEARIPWADLYGASPVTGQVIGFNIQGVDNDQAVPAQDTVFGLSEKAQAPVNPANWIQAVLTGATPPVKGDLNGDGSVTAVDAMLALRIAGGLEDIGSRMLQGNVAGADSVVDIQDAVRILRKATGKDTF